MAGKVKVINKLPQFIDAVERKAARAVTMACIRGSSELPAITPVDTSTLMNGLFRSPPSISGTKVSASVGFLADYAIYVHNAKGTLKGQPRPKRNGKSQGFYWGPHDGQPRFLEKAFERAYPDIRVILSKAMRV